MPDQKIIVIPPTEEQALPCFHVESDLVETFCSYLEASGVRRTKAPVELGPVGPDGREMLEIEVLDVSVPRMEIMAADFLAGGDTGSH